MPDEVPSEQDIVKIIEGMGQFMRNTNEILATVKVRLDNMQVDIGKLQRRIKENKIITV